MELFHVSKKPTLKTVTVQVIFSQILTSLGAFGEVGLKDGPPASETIQRLRLWMTWVFDFGLVGLGTYIDFKELAQAGGAPLKLGLIVGTTKYVLALVVVLLIKNHLVAI